MIKGITVVIGDVWVDGHLSVEYWFEQLREKITVVVHYSYYWYYWIMG